MTGTDGPDGSGVTGPSGDGAGRFRVVVDRDLCQGHGVCESEAPDVFEVPRKATTVTVLDAEPSASQRAAVEAAVEYCPTHALRIEEIEP